MVTYIDKWEEKGWENLYQGKDYGHATEILTMGFERLIKEPRQFAKQDPE